MTDPVSLRFPAVLREKLDKSAKKAGRSLNAEIRIRIESSFEVGFDGRESNEMLGNEIETLRAEIRHSVHTLTQNYESLDVRVAALEPKT